MTIFTTIHSWISYSQTLEALPRYLSTVDHVGRAFPLFDKPDDSIRECLESKNQLAPMNVIYLSKDTYPLAGTFLYRNPFLFIGEYVYLLEDRVLFPGIVKSKNSVEYMNIFQEYTVRSNPKVVYSFLDRPTSTPKFMLPILCWEGYQFHKIMYLSKIHVGSMVQDEDKNKYMVKKDMHHHKWQLEDNRMETTILHRFYFTPIQIDVYDINGNQISLNSNVLGRTSSNVPQIGKITFLDPSLQYHEIKNSTGRHKVKDCILLPNDQGFKQLLKLGKLAPRVVGTIKEWNQRFPESPLLPEYLKKPEIKHSEPYVPTSRRRLVSSLEPFSYFYSNENLWSNSPLQGYTQTTYMKKNTLPWSFENDRGELLVPKSFRKVTSESLVFLAHEVWFTVLHLEEFEGQTFKEVFSDPCFRHGEGYVGYDGRQIFIEDRTYEVLYSLFRRMNPDFRTENVRRFVTSLLIPSKGYVLVNQIKHEQLTEILSHSEKAISNYDHFSKDALSLQKYLKKLRDVVSERLNILKKDRYNSFEQPGRTIYRLGQEFYDRCVRTRKKYDLVTAEDIFQYVTKEFIPLMAQENHNSVTQYVWQDFINQDNDLATPNETAQEIDKISFDRKSHTEQNIYFWKVFLDSLNAIETTRFPEFRSFDQEIEDEIREVLRPEEEDYTNYGWFAVGFLILGTAFLIND